MGVIFRQTLKSTIYSYVGVIIGFVTVGWFMPHYLSKEEIGVMRQIQYYGMFFGAVLGLGVPQSVVRLFPHFKNKQKKNFGFATLAILITIISAVAFIFIFQNFGEGFLQKDIQKSPLFGQYYSYILPFTIAVLFFSLFDSYATSNQESTIGVFLRDFVLRLVLFIVILLYIQKIISYDEWILANVYSQFIPVFLIIVFLIIKGLLPLTYKISFPSKSLKKEFISTSGYNWINGLSAVAVVTIDSIMLSKLTDSASVGVYTTVTFFAGLMLIPNKNLGKIATSVIANHFKNNKFEEINSIYKKSAFTPYILGLFLLGNLILTIPFTFEILLKNEFNSGIWVLIFLAISNLFKMSSGVKFAILFNSKYYKWSTPMFMGFVLLIIITNFIFIPQYGIVGAALASLIATTIFHLSGVIFIKIKFGFNPFDSQFIKLGFVFLLLATFVYLIPDFNEPVIASILKSGIFSIIYLLFIYYYNITPDLIEPFQKLLKIKRKI